MSLEIIQPGLLTTLQDSGRTGYQNQGIVVSGAMDVYACQLANFLVGNFEEEAVIEVSMIGPTIRFLKCHIIAITGADLAPMINGQRIRINYPVRVNEKSILSFDAVGKGRFCYVSIKGGFDVGKIFGSYSTYRRSNLGGFHGRALKAADLLPTRSCEVPTDSFFTQASWTPFDPEAQSQSNETIVRITQGPEWSVLPQSHEILEDDFMVTAQSDRMGYRLSGVKTTFKHSIEILSSAVCFGTIQVPPDGNPIILMAECQTTGGYPRMANVSHCDLGKVAQVLPGKSIRFKLISHLESQALYLERQKKIYSLKIALELKQWNQS